MKRCRLPVTGKGQFVLLCLLLCYTVSPAQAVVSLKNKCVESLLILADDLIRLQDTNPKSVHYGALYCKTCADYHTRASESVLPFAVAYKESGKERYLKAALLTGEWLIRQQRSDGAWIETPSDWTGTTTDQLLAMSVAYPIVQPKLSVEQSARWKTSIKKAADWLVSNMNHNFASINYCATTTATMRIVFRIIPDSAYVRKAKELAFVVLSQMDDDYFLTGEGNRIRNTKYGVDLGYNMDMSMWGLGLYAKLSGDSLADYSVQQALKRLVYFIYPDGSTDGSWGVRSSKWTTYGSMTADGSQILFSLHAQNEPIYRTAALANLEYLMKMRKNGLLTLGPNYEDMFTGQPCIYPTFCRAKNLAMAITFGDQTEGATPNIPTQRIGWAKYFKTIDVALVRTKNIMATITGYRYKDMRQGSNFKYMHRASGGAITNLWIEGYGHLQASGQTEYREWEMNYPKTNGTLSLTPRIEFIDTNAYYTNLYEFDARMDLSQTNGVFTIESAGELKDKNRWEGGVAYTLTHTITDTSIEKDIKLRYHGNRPVISIIEPIIQNANTIFKRIDARKIEILGGAREFVFEVLGTDETLELGNNAEQYRQPLPALKGYPITITVTPNANSYTKEVKYRIIVKEKHS